MSTTLTERRLGIRWLALAALALVAAWLTTAHLVPIYDGINAPDEPYRYVTPPAGAAKTAAPTAATAQSPATGGLNTADLRGQSAESGPQIQVVVPKLAAQAPESASSISLQMRPLAPDVQPDLGPIDGNVYRLTLTAAGGQVSFRADQPKGALRIRATTDSQPGPLVVYRPAPGQPWTSLQTTRVGNDIYQADLSGVGDYALAFRAKDVPQTRPGSSSTGGGVSPAVYAVIGLLVVSAIAAGLLATRRRQAGQR